MLMPSLTDLRERLSRGSGFGCMLPSSDADFRPSESEALGSEATNLCFDVPHLEILMQGSV